MRFPFGTASINAFVYGCRGRLITASAGPDSTTRPRYITITRREMCSTTARSCAIKR